MLYLCCTVGIPSQLQVQSGVIVTVVVEVDEDDVSLKKRRCVIRVICVICA